MKILRTLALTSAALALVAAPVSTTAESHAMAMEYAVKNVDELEFVPFGEDGLTMSVLWGNPMESASGFLLKIPAGYTNVPHTHTANYRLFVIKGSGKHWTADETMDSVAAIGPGGYWNQPAGEVHTDASVSDEEALALVIFDGPFDIHAVE